jgi:DNA-binding NarL/FixJ family response regulator
VKRISVLLADDHAVVRQGLRALIEIEPEIFVVGEAANGREAVALAGKLQPSVVLMDVAMPVLNGIEATRQIILESPGTKVLVLSSYSTDWFVKDMVRAGAAGYLVKQTAAADLLKAIREVHEGNAFFSPSIAARLRDSQRHALVHGRGIEESRVLSPRELQALQRIARGFSNKEIAVDLGISIKTVEKHRQQVMNKLNIHDIAGLTRYAVAQGMLEADLPSTSWMDPTIPVPLPSTPTPAASQG